MALAGTVYAFSSYVGHLLRIGSKSSVHSMIVLTAAQQICKETWCYPANFSHDTYPQVTKIFNDLSSERTLSGQNVHGVEQHFRARVD